MKSNQSTLAERNLNFFIFFQLALTLQYLFANHFFLRKVFGGILKRLKPVVFFTLFSMAAMTSGYWMWLVLVLFPLAVVVMATLLLAFDTVHSFLMSYRSRPSLKKVKQKVRPIAISPGAAEAELTFLPITF